MDSLIVVFLVSGVGFFIFVPPIFDENLSEVYRFAAFFAVFLNVVYVYYALGERGYLKYIVGFFKVVAGISIAALFLTVAFSFYTDIKYGDSTDFSGIVEASSQEKKVDTNPVDFIKENSWSSESCKMRNFPTLFDEELRERAFEFERERAKIIGTSEEDIIKQYEMFANYAVLYCARNWNYDSILIALDELRKGGVASSEWSLAANSVFDYLSQVDIRQANFADLYLTLRSFQFLFLMPDQLYPDFAPNRADINDILNSIDLERSLSRPDFIEFNISDNPRITFYVQPYVDVSMSDLLDTDMNMLDSEVSEDSFEEYNLLSLPGRVFHSDVAIAAAELKFIRIFVSLYIGLNLLFENRDIENLDIYLVSEKLSPICNGEKKVDSAFYCPSDGYVFVYVDENDVSVNAVSDLFYSSGILTKLFHEISHHFSATELRVKVPFLAEVVATAEGEYVTTLFWAGVNQKKSGEESFPSDFKNADREEYLKFINSEKLEDILLLDSDRIRGFINTSRENVPFTYQQKKSICEIKDSAVTADELYGYLTFGGDFTRNSRKYSVAWVVGHISRVGEFSDNRDQKIIGILEMVAKGLRDGERGFDLWKEHLSPISSRVNNWVSGQSKVMCR